MPLQAPANLLAPCAPGAAPPGPPAELPAELPAEPLAEPAAEPLAEPVAAPEQVLLDVVTVAEPKKKLLPVPPEDLAELRSPADLELYSLEALKKLAKRLELALPRAPTRAACAGALTAALFPAEDPDTRVVCLAR